MRRPLQPGAFALDYDRRNRTGSLAAQRGAEHAALTKRLRGARVSLAPAGAERTAAPDPIKERSPR